MCLTPSIAWFGDPFLDGKKWHFGGKSATRGYVILPGGKVSKSQSFRSCVFLRRPIRRMDESSILMLLNIQLKAMHQKLRAPAVHGVSSYSIYLKNILFTEGWIVRYNLFTYKIFFLIVGFWPYLELETYLKILRKKMIKNIQINVGTIFEKYIGNFEKIIHILFSISVQNF